MPFHLHPILDQISTLYQMPRSKERFAHYLHILQGPSKGDLILPIGGYNPMGGESVTSTSEKLEALDAEEIMAKELNKLNESLSDSIPDITVVLNIADDIGGAWSQRYLTDYSSKFDITALVKRQFCTPFVWTSEILSKKLIIERTQSYAYRTLYWLQHGKPTTLGQIIRQEVEVQGKCDVSIAVDLDIDYDLLDSFFQTHQASEAYDLIFNFLYGDEASEYFAYKEYGLPKRGGLEYIKFVIDQDDLRIPKN